MSYLHQRWLAKVNGETVTPKKAKPINLDEWYDVKFEQLIEICQGNCEICKTYLGPSMTINPRTVVCHILGKAKNQFPTVATASTNFFYGCEKCHNAFDKASSDEIKEMKIYDTLVERIRPFYHLITEREKSKLKDCFRLDSLSAAPKKCSHCGLPEHPVNGAKCMYEKCPGVPIATPTGIEGVVIVEPAN